MELLALAFIMVSFVIMFEFEGTLVVPIFGISNIFVLMWLLNSLNGGV